MCIYMYMYVCIYIYIYMYILVVCCARPTWTPCKRIHRTALWEKRLRFGKGACTCVYMYIYVCLYVCLFVCLFACMFVCVCICMYVYIYIYIYIIHMDIMLQGCLFKRCFIPTLKYESGYYWLCHDCVSSVCSPCQCPASRFTIQSNNPHTFCTPSRDNDSSRSKQ